MRPKPKTGPEKPSSELEADLDAQPGYLWELVRIPKYVLTLNHPNLTLSLVYHLTPATDAFCKIPNYTMKYMKGEKIISGRFPIHKTKTEGEGTNGST